MSTTPRHRRGAPRFALCALLLLTGLLATSAAAAPGAACGFCGKNLIKNPGADLGAGITAVDAFGAVPGWTNEAGQFGAASYTFPNGWFSVRSKGPKDRGKNYFFGGTTRAAIEVAGNDRQADDQAARGGRRQEGDAQRLARELRQELRPGPGSVRGCVRRSASRAVKIGPDTTISGTDMQARSRSIKVPAGAKQVTIVVSFGGDGAAYKLAGADDLSLVLA